MTRSRAPRADAAARDVRAIGGAGVIATGVWIGLGAAHATGIAGVPPTPQPDVPILTIALFAALNPAVAVVGYLMGRRADQVPKLLVAAFVAAIAGVALLWLAAFVRTPFVAGPARAAVGIFIAQLAVGYVWAMLGFAMRR